MPASPPSLPDQERRKRRREKVFIALTLLLVVGLTSLEIFLVRRQGYPLTGSLLVFGLLNLNAILFLLFTFLVFRHLTRLFLERRRRVFGSRLRTRLVLSFMALALIPTLFMFFIAWQLISGRLDQQWDTVVGDAMDQTLALGKVFSQGLKEKLKAVGDLCRRELEVRGRLDLKELTPLLSSWAAVYQLSALELVTPQGVPLAQARGETGGEKPPPPLPPLKPEHLSQGGYHRQTIPGGVLMSLVVPVFAKSPSQASYLLVRQVFPGPLLAQIMNLERRSKELRQSQVLLKPVKVSHYFTLVVVTLLTLMAAIWLAFYMAREITTPIRQLAEGALKVAGGDYDFHIDQEGKDEIGFLVQSFNKMTQDLQASQSQLAQALDQLRRSLAEQEAQKRYMEILLKNVAAGVIGIDPRGRITNINDSAAQILQVQRDQVLGREARSLLPPGEYEHLAEVAATARRSGRTVQKPIQLSYPDKTLHLVLKATALKDEQDRDLGLVVVFEDLTELERAQRQAAWREVARRIAHEVKNPLTPIKLAAQRLRRRYLGKVPDDGRIIDECTQIISDQVDEIKNLVNEFSRFARLPHLTLAPHDLNALVQDILSRYQEVQPRVSLHFTPDPHLPEILIDQEQFKRVLMNLLDNALASLPDGGEISLEVKGDPAAERVRLVVADTGVGIPERDKARIFEPYFSTKRGGTGLGLAIVNSIVADHDGQIRVEDNTPRGSRFVIELPLRRATHESHDTRH